MQFNVSATRHAATHAATHTATQCITHCSTPCNSVQGCRASQPEHQVHVFNLCTHMDGCVYIHVYVYTHTHIYIYIYIRTYTHTQTHTNTHSPTYTHTHAHTQAHTHTHKHAHTHTHTGEPQSARGGTRIYIDTHTLESIVYTDGELESAWRSMHVCIHVHTYICHTYINHSPRSKVYMHINIHIH